MKEDLTIELQNKFNRDTNAERVRLREEFEDEKTRFKEELEDEKTRFKEVLEARMMKEFEARYSQTFQDLKSKADEFEAKTNELGVLLDESKTENNNLKEQIVEHKLKNKGLI